MKSSLRISAAIAAMTLVTAAPRQSHAQTGIGEAIGFAKVVYDAYTQFQALLNGSGPSLSQQLAAMQTSILNAIHTTQNESFIASATTSFNSFNSLANYAPNDPTAPNLLSQTLINTETSMNLYNQMVSDVASGVVPDSTSVYQLTAAYTTLVAVHTGLEKMKGELFPGFPATWADNNNYLQPAMNTLYTLVGADHYRCARGTDTRGYYEVAPEDGGTLAQVGRSVFFKRLENSYVQVGTFSGTAELGNDCHWGTVTGPENCNPVTGICQAIFAPSRCNGMQAVWVTNPTSVKAALVKANGSFKLDPTVNLVQVTMNDIMNLGGGTAAANSASKLLPELREMVDPYVNEPACTAITGGSTAYPAYRTDDPPVPVSFNNGHFTTGDSTNFFPSQQVQLWTGNGTLSRSNPVDTSTQTPHKLVLRYANGHTGSAFVNVGLNNWDNGNPEATFGVVEFPPTPAGYWAEKVLTFTPTSSWAASSYVRLAPSSGAISYFDAVWVTN